MFDRTTTRTRHLAWALTGIGLVVLISSCAPATTPGSSASRSAPGTLGTQKAALSPRCSAGSQTITFQDEELAQAVMRALDKPRDATSVSCSDLADLTSVTASGVESLDGLEYAVNLSSVKLDDTTLTSLAPLSGLPRL